MKIEKNGEIVIPAALVKTFGFKPGDSIQMEVSHQGILIKAEENSTEAVKKWLLEKHGDEMATLTTAQILQFLKK